MKQLHTNNEDMAVFVAMQVALALRTVGQVKMPRQEIIDLKNTYRQTLSNPDYFKDSYILYNAIINEPDEITVPEEENSKEA